jgi:hypothetical protein
VNLKKPGLGVKQEALGEKVLKFSYDVPFLLLSNNDRIPAFCS